MLFRNLRTGHKNKIIAVSRDLQIISDLRNRLLSGIVFPIAKIHHAYQDIELADHK